MADALIAIAVEKLMSMAQRELQTVVGVTQEIENLSSAFTVIQAVLNDAEKRQMKEEPVRDWLRKLKYVAYDVDDLLDGWRTDTLRSQINRGDMGKAKVPTCSLSPFFCFKQVALRHKIGHKIKELHKRLDMISDEKNKFHFLVDHSKEKKEERQTGSLINEKEIFGRTQDKETIVSWLLSESSQQREGVPIISIIGMGGLGKTTLAQQVYNDDKVKNHFVLRIWVCVSEDFDVGRLTKKIIEGGTKATCEQLDLNLLQEKLCGLLNGKRFLLVLDDVWEENGDKFRDLKLPLKEGADGSRVVVTTRNLKVAKAMGTTHTHSLGFLLEDDCWSLFEHRALGDRKREERLKLEAVGREIVKKCKGVPLAVKVIGGVMQEKRTKEEWVRVLESDIWGLEKVGKGIYPALLLSYYNLPTELKQCFAYCAVFPQDYQIKYHILIKLWMAQGFISTKGQIDDMEGIGGEYFNDLLGRSLLQDVSRDDDGNVLSCKMHDMVHDLAQFITNGECHVMGMEERHGTHIKARHLCCYNMESFLSHLHGPTNLRTLIGFKYSNVQQVPRGIFGRLRCLRVLDLSYSGIEVLPSSVDILKHLRYLDLSGTWIMELPNSVTSLCNMQTLRLNRCYKLKKLPEGVGKLINLKYLELQGPFDYLPRSIEKLTSLRTLSTFFIGNRRSECTIGALKDLNLLQGSLEIYNLERVANEAEANEAQLNKKRNLHRLALWWSARNDLDDGEEWEEAAFARPSGARIVALLTMDHLLWSTARSDLDDGEVKREEAVFECLRPSTNLMELKIYLYMGSKFPSWMEDSLFSNLIEVELKGCRNCIQLPALGKLPSLKHLYIAGMEELKKVGREFYGIGGVFPKLDELVFHDMDKLEEWELRIDDGEMPCLRFLRLKKCPKLKAPHFLPKTLTILDIDRCGKGDWASCVPLFVAWLTFRGNGDEMQLTQLPSLNNLKYLSIHDFPNLTSLPNGIGQLQKLEHLYLSGISKLSYLPEELQHLTSLQELHMEYCPLLEDRCQREVGEDWRNISHIPNIWIW